ncbi:hypothetical protein P8452_66559 [Trifolium repens]|nr:hypothetical protein P8452_66559 [Trifolium repens]
MDSISASEQGIENNVNNKQFLPRKPARQPNQELLRTIAFLANATQPAKALTYNKAYVNDESEEWITYSDDESDSVVHDEKGKQEPHMSIHKSSSNINNNDYYINNRKKKTSQIDRTKANKECDGVSRSSSHVIYVKDTIQTLDCYQEQRSCKAFIQFCSAQIICPQEERSALAIKLYGIQAALLSALGNPFENLSQSMSSKNSSQILVVGLGKAFIGFLPAMIWTGMITLQGLMSYGARLELMVSYLLL